MKRLAPLAALTLFATAFILVSHFAQTHKAALAAFLEGDSGIGVILFIALTALFVVFVIPLDVVFLIPLGTALFGPVPTALMSITGWTLGAGIAFLLARRFGAPLVGRIVSLERVRRLEARLPRRRRFGAVVLLRMLVSVDILSYALGLASAMPLSSYLAATAIGVAPFGFYFAYAGALPFWYQAGAIALALILASAVLAAAGRARES